MQHVGWLSEPIFEKGLQSFIEDVATVEQSISMPSKVEMIKRYMNEGNEVIEDIDIGEQAEQIPVPDEA